jgi:hypothetical protein
MRCPNCSTDLPRYSTVRRAPRLVLPDHVRNNLLLVVPNPHHLPPHRLHRTRRLMRFSSPERNEPRSYAGCRVVVL